MSCLKKVEYYKIENQEFYMMTGFNTCTEEYQIVFCWGLTVSVKNINEQNRNIKYYIETKKYSKIDYKPKCF